MAASKCVLSCWCVLSFENTWQNSCSSERESHLLLHTHTHTCTHTPHTHTEWTRHPSPLDSEEYHWCSNNSLSCRRSCVLSSIHTSRRAQCHQYLGHYGRCGLAHCTIMCDGQSVYTGHRGSVNKKRCGHEEQQQEWTDVKLQYLLQLRHSIVTWCVCIHMQHERWAREQWESW